MDAPSNESLLKNAPRIIPALTSGFNAVANHAYLIIIPMIVDLFLWLGPHMNLNKLLSPSIAEITDLMLASDFAEIRPLVDTTKVLWAAFLERFNLFSTIRTYPIGIPSLLASRGPLENPLGKAFLLDMGSTGEVILYWLLLSLVGLLLGTIYFGSIARAVTMPKPVFNSRIFGWQTFQVFALTISLIIALAVICIPLLMITSIFSMLSSVLAQFATLALFFVLLWLLIPLIFTPHAIFVNGQNFFNAMLNSTRLVRFFLPGTSMFLVFALGITQVLDMLWNTPAENSWLMLMGIFGHAFVCTGLFAASFYYYAAGSAWVKENLPFLTASRGRKI